MALNVDTLAAGMADAVINARLPDVPAVDANNRLTRQARIDALRPLARAIITHLEVNAVVTGVCPSGGGPLGAGRIT